MKSKCILFSFLAIASLLLLSPALYAGDINKPNVLLLIVDDLRTELGCYGVKHVKSPCIDKLADSGMVFERAYCSSPICGPSRVAMLTSSRLKTARQSTSASVRGEKLFPEARSIPYYFKKSGYTTVTAGKVFHEVQDYEKDWSRLLTDFRNLKDTPEHRKYEEKRTEGRDRKIPELTMIPIDPVSFSLINARTGRGPVTESPDVEDTAYTDGKLAELAVSELKRLKEEGKPFFFACGFTRPHLPFYAPKKYWDLYEREKIPLASNNYRPKNAPKELVGSTEFTQYHLRGLSPGSEEFARMMKHGYLASTSYMDAQVGKVLTALEQLSLDKDTIVILWGDHGWNLGEHQFWGKHNLLNTSMRCPVIIRVPGMPSGHNKSVVESLDILPTLCELASIEISSDNLPHISGKSLYPLLKEKNASWDKPAFCRFGKGETIITRKYSYTRYDKGEKGHRMLFDYSSDKEENNNVAESPQYAKDIKVLDELLDKNMRETH